jgi:hypothetical protein
MALYPRNGGFHQAVFGSKRADDLRGARRYAEIPGFQHGKDSFGFIHGIFLSIKTSAASLHWSMVSWSAASSQARIRRMASVMAWGLVARAPSM